MVVTMHGVTAGSSIQAGSSFLDDLLGQCPASPAPRISPSTETPGASNSPLVQSSTSRVAVELANRAAIARIVVTAESRMHAPKNTTKKYSAHQKEWYAWCQEQWEMVNPEGDFVMELTEEQKLEVNLVDPKKVLVFLTERVVGREHKVSGRKRRRQDGDVEDSATLNEADSAPKNTVGFKTVSGYLSALIQLYNDQKCILPAHWKTPDHPRSADV